MPKLVPTALAKSGDERYEYHLTLRSTRALTLEELADLFDLSPPAIRLVTTESSDASDHSIITDRRSLPVEDAVTSGIPNVSAAIRKSGLAGKADIRPLDDPDDATALKDA